jgi:tetratricopeptide (TPR) repeat protein
LARTSHYALDVKEALLHAQRALILAREHDLKDLIARSLNALAYAQDIMSNWVEVAACAEEASTLYAALGNRAMEADCLTQVGKALIYLGRSQEGVRVVRAAHKISAKIENAWGQAYSSILLTLGLQEIGAYTEALAVIQQGLTLARTQSFRRLLIECLLFLGLVEGMLFSQRAARATLQEAATVNEAFGLQIATEAIAATMCMAHALAGEWDEAVHSALQVQAARNYRFSYVGHLTFCYETEALLRGGEIERAEEGVQRFGACVGENRRYRIAYLRALAVLTSWKGETHQAVAYLQEGLRLSEELGLPGEQWHIEAALGELYQALGDERQGHEAFTRAAKVVQALANALQDEQLRKRFLSARCVQRLLT